MKKDGTFPIKFYVHTDILPKRYKLCKLISSKKTPNIRDECIEYKRAKTSKAYSADIHELHSMKLTGKFLTLSIPYTPIAFV